jgi:hypothetical protein
MEILDQPTNRVTVKAVGTGQISIADVRIAAEAFVSLSGRRSIDSLIFSLGEVRGAVMVRKPDI